MSLYRLGGVPEKWLHVLNVRFFFFFYLSDFEIPQLESNSAKNTKTEQIVLLSQYEYVSITTIF